MHHADHDLLLWMRHGDAAAARELWSRHAPRLTAYARAILARDDPAGAPDIVQSAFLAALRAPRAEARAVHDPAAWLLRLTRNLALNHLRSLRRERRRLEAVATTAARAAAPSPTGDIAAALAALPRPLREIVTLKHAADLSFDQMSAALGQNRSTIASRYRKAIALLRAQLDPHARATGAQVLHAQP